MSHDGAGCRYPAMGEGRDGLATLASTASQTNVLNLKGICARKSNTLNGD